MNLPSDTPKMQKWMFWVGDFILIVAAWFIHDGAEHPNGGLALILTVLCVVAAVFVAVIPAIVEYARNHDEALDTRQRSLQAIAVTVAAASEQVSIAATGLQGIAEAAQDNFSKSEQLSKQINEKIAELEARLASMKKDDGEAVAKLESIAKKIGKAAAEFEASIEKAAEAAKMAASAAAAHIDEVPPVIASRIAEIRPAVSASDHPFEKIAVPLPPPPTEPPKLEVPSAAEAAPAPAEVSAPPPVEEIAAEPAAPTPPAPEPRKRSPRKPKPAPEAAPLAAEVEGSPAEAPPPAPEAPAPAKEIATPSTDFALESPPVEEPAAPAPSEISEPALSSDGATRLVVTAYIGIGNRIFIRGEGPGLSWEKGVPLNFISIGKWRWESHDAVSTVRFKLYKNDQIECTALGESAVEPGAQRELSASF